jgi:hypothetical protein
MDVTMMYGHIFRAIRLPRSWQETVLFASQWVLAAVLALTAMAHLWAVPLMNKRIPAVNAHLSAMIGRTVLLGKCSPSWFTC